MNTQPRERIILWYEDLIGKSGKSYLVTWLEDNNPSICVHIDICKLSDMAFMVKP